MGGRNHLEHLGRQQDNIRMVLKETGWEGVNRDQWQALINVVMNL
jgi:hypothetical protein